MPKSKKKNIELAKTANGALAANEKDLDELTDRAKECMREGAVLVHRLGTIIQEVHDRGAYAHRLGEDGKPVYGTVIEWCDRELGVSRTAAYTAIKAAQTFVEEDLTGLSGNVLRAVLLFPAHLLPRALRAARAGESATTLSDWARASKNDPEGAVIVFNAKPKAEGKLYLVTDRRLIGTVEGATPARAEMMDADPKARFWAICDLGEGVEMLIEIFKEGGVASGKVQAAVSYTQLKPPPARALLS